MSLSGMYGQADDEESLQVLKKAVEIGCTFWDSAVIYGFGHNETTGSILQGKYRIKGESIPGFQVRL
jgi:aryl-alcohol dehydrogenase-like predicted oxidoreductase